MAYNMKKIAFIVIYCLFVLISTSEAQIIDRIKVGAGLSTMTILGDSPATKPFVSRDSLAGIGGSFNAAMPGFALKLILESDKYKNFRIPIDMDWTFFTSGERYPVSSNLVINYWHSVQNIGLGTGLYYSFFDLTWANAKLYAGIDIKANFINNAEFSRKEKYFLAPERDTTIVIFRKKSAVRLGGFLRIGLEGELVKKWSINTSVALGSMNLIGRDDARGYLLTPLPYSETKEEFVNLLNFSMMLQYRFDLFK